MYLAANTRPDIAYAVHQAARFSQNPKNSHALTIKHILRYLEKTQDKGMYMPPDGYFKLSCYVDSDFGGLFGSEDPGNPVSVKSRTG